MSKSGLKIHLPQNPLFRLLLINGVIGVFVSLLVLGGLFWTNVGNLRTLVMASSEPLLPIIMLAAGLVITLGSVVMGSAVMMMKTQDGPGKTGGKMMKIAEGLNGRKGKMVPVTVPARPKR